ncbi:hypothetical protein GcM3_200056 [Golovinomyces cichoracearum]|uniref:Uncharacterized protein n=1 Tax=Golovinomyces cichoracearum TaxID=62708 RepID=A0A420HDW1_9PEZI|nr:hypothetical protein GcM3_200056 [Golovinomyces cichoracearum]
MKNFERTGGQTAHPVRCAVIIKTYKSCENDETVIHTILSSRDEMILTYKSDLMSRNNILEKKSQTPVANGGPFRKTNAWVPTLLQSNAFNPFGSCAKSQKTYHSQS